MHRSDGSGTTWIFSSYLDKVSPAWHDKVGWDKTLNWPVGVGGKGNEGVAANVQQQAGSIGYVEFAYAVGTKMVHAQLQNRAGKFVQPTLETFAAAAAQADWAHAPGMYMVLTEQPGENSWPITGASFILIYKQQSDADKAEAMLKFFDWCNKSGAGAAKELYYVPLPGTVIAQVESLWANELTADGRKVWK